MQRETRLIQQCVNRVLSSDCFARSPQARRFLKFVVEKSLAEETTSLKAYTIGVSALGVNEERSCPETTARMQASRVRRLLAKYYQLEGQADPLELSLRTGTYQPQFLPREIKGREEYSLPRVRVADFENVSADRLDAPLVSGLGESLLGLLVNCRHLKVSRADDLSPEGLSYVLCGSVTRIGDAVRVSSSVRAPTGRETIWSERFDLQLTLENYLAIQDEVALKIASRVGDPAAGVVAKHERSEVPDPAHASVQHFHQMLASPTLDHLHGSITELEAALPHARGGSEVHAAYSCALSLRLFVRSADRKRDLISAEAHARSAVNEDSTCALGHLARGLVHYHHREGACARRELLRAIELNPISCTVQGLCGFLLALMGHWKEGLKQVDAAREKAGTIPGYVHLAYGIYYFHEVGDYARGLFHAEQVDLEESLVSDLLSCACLSRLGRLVDARKFASRVTSRAPSFAKSPTKGLAGLFYLEELTDSLVAALSDAGLGSRAEVKRVRPEFKVSVSRRPLPSEIRVGVLHSLSGTMALSEAHLVSAVLLGIEEINQAGGVLGRPVRALVEDGASDPATFQEKAQKLVTEDQVSSVFGCWTSSSRKAVLPVIERADALLWYPLQYEGLEKSKHVVYTGSCLNQQIEPAVRWALKRKRNRAYLIGSDYVFPRTVNRLIRALVESMGGRIMGESYQPLGSARFDALAKDIARLKPEIVYNTVNGSENVELFRALGRAGVSAKETTVMSFSLSELELSACGPAAEGQLACWSYFQSMDTPKNKDLVARFRRRYGEQEVLSDPAVTAYSQIHLWKSVVEKAQSLDTEDLLVHLPGCRLELGDESYEVLSNHHVERRAQIGRAQGGQFEVIWSSPEVIAPQPWLGVDTTDSLSRDLILGALQALPEMAERSSALTRDLQIASDALNAP